MSFSATGDKGKKTRPFLKIKSVFGAIHKCITSFVINGNQFVSLEIDFSILPSTLFCRTIDFKLVYYIYLFACLFVYWGGHACEGRKLTRRAGPLPSPPGFQEPNSDPYARLYLLSHAPALGPYL